MDIRKNFEAVFLVAAVAGLFGSWATSDKPVINPVSHTPAASAAIDSTMQVVIIKGKRLTAAEKAALA